MNTQTVLHVADLMLFVREEPFASNAGRWVEAIQRVGGATKGAPWCACAVSLVLGIAFKGQPPIPYTASCDEILKVAERWEWLSDNPTAGDVFLVMRSPTDAVHTGIVTGVQGSQFNTAEWNASDPSKPATRDGWGGFRRTRAIVPGKYKFVKYPRGAS